MAEYVVYQDEQVRAVGGVAWRDEVAERQATALERIAVAVERLAAAAEHQASAARLLHESLRGAKATAEPDTAGGRLQREMAGRG